MTIKKISASIAMLVTLFGSFVAPALAASNPKATGSVGYTALGLQRYITFDAHQKTTNCVTHWDVTGNYDIGFVLDNDSTVYTHDATFTQTGSSLTGSGGYPAGGPHTYAWDVTAGNVTGNTITLTVVYNSGAIGTTMHMTGTIANNGTMSGTWDDNFGGSRTGTWSTSSGAATETFVSCEGKGNLTYTDVNGDWYYVKVNCALVNDTDAVFSGQVLYASNPGWINLWLVAKVHDGGTPGKKGDTVSGDFVNSDPQCNQASISNGPFDVTSGNLVVHN